MGYLIFDNHISLACTFALSSPKRAREHARYAHSMAVKMQRPDMAAKANDLLSAI